MALETVCSEKLPQSVQRPNQSDDAERQTGHSLRCGFSFVKSSQSRWRGVAADADDGWTRTDSVRSRKERQEAVPRGPRCEMLGAAGKKHLSSLSQNLKQFLPESQRKGHKAHQESPQASIPEWQLFPAVSSWLLELRDGSFEDVKSPVP